MKYLCGLSLLLFFRISWFVLIIVFEAETTGASNNNVNHLESESSHECSKFKAPNANTTHNLVEEWKTDDETLWKYVNEKVPAVMEHTGSSTFDQHLKGVQAVLRYWNSPKYLTDAGLFHSIYGTEGFQGFSIPLTERSAIQDLIGMKAEKLAYVFCMVDRSTVDETVFDWKEEDSTNDETMYNLRARPELGRFDINLTKEEWVDFIELNLADWLEQVEGAAMKSNPFFLWKAGEAYAYRRLAYRKMKDVLSVERKERLIKIPGQMLESVMSTENPETRHLVQPRNPPVSAAAEAAFDALRSNGEPIPIDLSPQPMHIFLTTTDEL